MGDLTGISWADKTWNLIYGCTRVSDGCLLCYIDRTTPFRVRGLKFDKPGVGGSIPLTLFPERLSWPIGKWRNDPSRIFVNSLSDLFHRDVPDGFIARVWDVMAHAPQHQFLILTKRPGRMRSWVKRWADTAGDDTAGGGGFPPLPYGPDAIRAVYPSGRAGLFASMLEDMGTPPDGAAYPTYDWMEGPRWWPRVLPNVWLVVTAEDQRQADLRIPILLDTPAAVRGISVEPMLSPVDLAGFLPRSPDAPWYPVECRHGHQGCPICDRPVARGDGLDWVVCGGESGKDARPMDAAWASALQAQCGAAGVPYHFKQAGAVLAREWGCKDRAGQDPAEWPEQFPREYPT